MQKPPLTGRPHAMRVALTLVILAATSGCAVKPWVQPYERERLADPIMSFSRDALADRHRAHTQEVREGARGATAVAGGGCGCN